MEQIESRSVSGSGEKEEACEIEVACISASRYPHAERCMKHFHLNPVADLSFILYWKVTLQRKGSLLL